jgi:catechol 2,3-dioxygenase-like lactoylglutathione lyase family enzyme
MKTRHFDHIDLRVKSMEAARRFYAKLLPALGFTIHHTDAQWETYYAVIDGRPADFFGFTQDPNHRPNETRIAFWAENKEEVDRMADIVRSAGGMKLEGPELCAEYSPGYYAVFFEDPDGNKLEICHRQTASADN